MAYELLDAAQDRWRAVVGHELVADVIDGVQFKDGVRVRNDGSSDATDVVAGVAA